MQLVSERTVRQISHENLQFCSCKLAIVQELSKNDCPRRPKFAQEMLALHEQKENLMMVMSDEAHFYLNGDVSKQIEPMKIFFICKKPSKSVAWWAN